MYKRKENIYHTQTKRFKEPKKQLNIEDHHVPEIVPASTPALTNSETVTISYPLLLNSGKTTLNIGTVHSRRS